MIDRKLQENSIVRIVDDDEGFGDAIRFILKTEGWLVTFYSDTASFLKKDDPEVPLHHFGLPNAFGEWFGVSGNAGA